MGWRDRFGGGGRAALLVLLLALIATAALPASAGAFLYWANEGTGSAGTGSIGHSSNDGGGVTQNLISPLDFPCGVAVDASHIYWASSNSIGRANLDGNPASVNTNFISGATNACGVAVDGTHIYWGNGNAIGRANIDGNPASVNQSFITGAHSVCGVAVDAGHVYWGNFQPGPGTVGRADLAGTPASVNQSFVTGGAFLCGVAVDAGHVYWGNNGTGTIGRANIDGNPASVNQTFINAGASTGPSGIAVDATHIYWTAAATGAVGRANIDGTPGSIAPSFIPGAHSPFGIAVDPLPEASSSAVACSPSPLALPGSATCTATVRGAALAPTGTVAFTTSGSGAFTPASACTLVQTGAATAACQVTYTPSAAGVVSISLAYPGDENHGPSAGAAALQVTPLQRTLTVAIKGPGTVRSQPAGIDCGSTCTHAYDDGTNVTLTPSPAAAFTGWSGACSGRGSCQVAMTAARSVTATFAARPDTKIGNAEVNSKKRTATFKFKAIRAARGFQCALVSKKHKRPTFNRCRSPKTYKRLAKGTYTFEVRALGAAGVDSSPAKKTFRIR